MIVRLYQLNGWVLKHVTDYESLYWHAHFGPGAREDNKHYVERVEPGDIFTPYMATISGWVWVGDNYGGDKSVLMPGGEVP